jgi:hypothetical protein
MQLRLQYKPLGCRPCEHDIQSVNYGPVQVKQFMWHGKDKNKTFPGIDSKSYFVKYPSED